MACSSYKESRQCMLRLHLKAEHTETSLMIQGNVAGLTWVTAAMYGLLFHSAAHWHRDTAHKLPVHEHLLFFNLST
jgi:hypothetical protein